MRFEEQTDKLAVGDVTMVMYREGADGEIEVLQEQTFRNLIVSRASVLMARRMAPSTDYNTYAAGTYTNHIGNGFQYLELGKGVGTGNLQAPQQPDVARTALFTPFFRKAISSWKFLNADGSQAANTAPTNILELTTDILEAEAVDTITEMGLFGGDASTTLGTGHMFNHKTFAVWNKPNDARLKIIWKITF